MKSPIRKPSSDRSNRWTVSLLETTVKAFTAPFRVVLRVPILRVKVERSGSLEVFASGPSGHNSFILVKGCVAT